MTGEHYARTQAGELIGPYDTAEECNRELADSERERWSVELRSPSQMEIDSLGANASEGEAGGIWINGRLAAVSDEYGTATLAPWFIEKHTLGSRELTDAVETYIRFALGISLPSGAER